MAEKCITCLTDFFDGYIEQFADKNFVATAAAVSSDDIFTTSGLELVVEDEFTTHAEEVRRHDHDPLVSHNKSNINIISSWCSTSGNLQELVVEKETTIDSPSCRKRQKVEDGQVMSHITVERNRRKQMNHHLTVLRSLMPCFYVKRGDQASIIGGVVDYITELQQVLQSLEAKKQRKVMYSHEVLSPRPSPPPPLSPLPISPRTPLPLSPAAYRPSCLQQPLLASSYLQQQPPPSPSPLDPSLPNSSNSKSSIADVEVKFSGSNLLLKTISPRLPGQATKIVSLLQDLSLEILQAAIHAVDETMVNSFTIKIGIECQLSAEDLVQHIQQTFF